jgi:hypothetical protein
MIENISHGIGGWAEDRGRARAAALAERFSRVKSPDQVLAEWKAAYAELEKTSEINAAMYEGSKAQAIALTEALRTVAPSHTLFQAGGQKYSDGKSKSKLRLFFEAAFDKQLRTSGGVLGMNPKAHRKD